jgi:hypothetical protein
MPFVINRLTVTSIAVFALIAAAGAAEKDAPFQIGRAESYPTKQTNENVTIAAVPFTSDEQVKSAFGKLNPNRHGVLPVLVVIQNDTGKTLRLENLRVEYVTGDRSRIEATPAKDLAYLSEVRKPSIQNTPLPTGAPRVRRGKNPLADPQFEVRAFTAKMLPAGDQAGGFFYFQTPSRSGSMIYVTGIAEAQSGKELFYFEIPLSDGGNR